LLRKRGGGKNELVYRPIQEKTKRDKAGADIRRFLADIFAVWHGYIRIGCRATGNFLHSNGNEEAKPDAHPDDRQRSDPDKREHAGPAKRTKSANDNGGFFGENDLAFNAEL
jgi:hypothetical protein